MNSELSKRENEVMQLIAKGYTNTQICEKLYISMTTLKSHITSIYQKLCVNNVKSDNKPSMTRLRAVLIYLGLAKVENWI